MTKTHVLRTFRKAQFPLVSRAGFGRYDYISSEVCIRYYPDIDGDINVKHRMGKWTTFDSPSEALGYIRARLSIECVHSNDWALPAFDKTPSLSVIIGGAA